MRSVSRERKQLNKRFQQKMKKSKKTSQQHNFFHYTLFTLGFFIAAFFLSFFVGDKLLEMDHVFSAKVFYTIAKIINPLNNDVGKRLLAAQIVEEERKTHSEETDQDLLAEENTQQRVLGASVTVPVLMYHYIRINPDKNDKVGYNLSVIPTNFQAQMDYLAAHEYHTITLDELGAALVSSRDLPQKPIVITFDDGYRDAYTQAFPILKTHNFKAVNFIITGVVGAPAYLTWDQIEEMKVIGVFTFGAHTVTHRALTYLEANQIKREVSESKSILASHLGYPVNWFAYPYGNVNEKVANIVAQTGYVGAFGTNRGTFQSTDKMFALPRIRIGGSDTVDSFASKLPWK